MAKENKKEIKDAEITEEEAESKNGTYHGDPVLIFD